MKRMMIIPFEAWKRIRSWKKAGIMDHRITFLISHHESIVSKGRKKVLLVWLSLTDNVNIHLFCSKFEIPKFQISNPSWSHDMVVQIRVCLFND
jgi:hypothetical protein